MNYPCGRPTTIHGQILPHARQSTALCRKIKTKMEIWLFLKISLLLSLLIAPEVLLADDPAVVSTKHATVTLLSEQVEALPDQTLWLALRFELIPHWHVYWRNPGASGNAPSVRWTMPEGWEIGEIHWPVPKRIRVGPLTSYGYEEDVMFLVPVDVPPRALQAGTQTIIADAEWLVCKVECIPESGRLTLQLHKASSRFNTAADTRELFTAARAQLPEATALSGRYRLEGETLAISVGMPDTLTRTPFDVWFAANEWGPVDASGEQHWQRAVTALTLTVPGGDLPPGGGRPIRGLLVVESKHDGLLVRSGYQVKLAATPQAPVNPPPGLMTALLFAFLGGLILNIMPCVLPVLGIKILGFVREAGANQRRLALHGLTYTSGVLASFAVLAAILLIVRAGGESLGWGFQLQSPLLVMLLAYLMLLVGLNLSGIFSFGNRLMNAGQSLAESSGLFNTFATGVLAAVVASPCTAPFMGAALGYAITRTGWEAMAVFLTLGAGFALPVLLMSLFPGWLRYIPKPGRWMKTFQQVLAFPMYGTAAWLLWVLSQQMDARAYGGALAGLVMVAFAAWLYGQWRPGNWRLGLLGAGLAAILALTIGQLVTTDSPARSRAVSRDFRPWSEELVQELVAAGRPVFVNFTAAWCITCKVNEQLALSTDNIRQLFEARHVAYLVADWTRRDPAITQQLERYGRSGVPLYLLYSPASEQPLVLPQLLTEGIMAEAIHTL
jgi:thiol:disulfide interchange protein/DsbC/DsbD-like thiol-disulfide interchange protein